jgi:hypothetical protein
MTEFKGNKYRKMERTNKTPQNMIKSCLPSRTILKGKGSTPFIPIHNCKKTHCTSTKVVAKYEKQNKTPQKKEEYCMPYPTTCNNTINKI